MRNKHSEAHSEMVLVCIMLEALKRYRSPRVVLYKSEIKVGVRYPQPFSCGTAASADTLQSFLRLRIWSGEILALHLLVEHDMGESEAH